jgi:16S rRNA (guanine527-N7)-methyltransferase
MPSDLSEIVKTKNPTLSLKDLTKLESFINEAILFNNKHNIFVRTGPLEILEKDIDDCMHLVEKTHQKEKILDLGTGGGFPGIILGIIKKDCEIHLLEKSQKKCYFLKKIKDLLSLENIKVINTTITKKNNLGEYDLITARAFSSTKNILDLTQKNLKKNGRYILLKGTIEKIEEEMESINTNKYKYEIIKTDNQKFERHLIEIKHNE